MDISKVKLIYSTQTQDEDGTVLAQDTEIEVYAEKKSVKRSEFYSALQTGQKPVFELEIRLEDWELTKYVESGHVKYAESVKIGSEKYVIIRAYELDKSKISLTCG